MTSPKNTGREAGTPPEKAVRKTRAAQAETETARVQASVAGPQADERPVIEAELLPETDLEPAAFPLAARTVNEGGAAGKKKTVKAPKNGTKSADGSQDGARADAVRSRKAVEDTPEIERAEAEDEDEEPGLEEVEDLDDEALDLGLDVDDAQDDTEEPRSGLPVVSRPHLPSLSSSRDSLHLYLREVGRFPMLKPDEEFELARRVRENGDSDAAFRLVSSHLRLVVKIAMDFQRRWMQNVLDLIQEGNVGLMRAVHKFDPDKGIKFSYYAAFWIRAYILKFIMDNWRMVKIGTTQAQRKLFYNLNRERQKLIAEGFDPDASVLAERLGVGEDQIVEMQQRLDASDMSLDMPVGDEAGSASRMDFLPALGPGVEEGVAGREVAELLQDHIREILPSLSEKEVYILKHRLLTDDPVTLREIGERYNVTRERVRQLEARLLQKLRTYLSNGIADFSEDWINHA